MIFSKNNLENNLKDYKNINDKISRMQKSGHIFSIIRGLYTDNKDEDKEEIASRILVPSYLSFEYALSKYQLIPESVKIYTSATCGKKKKKIYETDFGVFIYYDIPLEIYKYGIKLVEKKDCKYFIASPCKALLDTLYKEPSLRSIKNLKEYLFDYMRIDEEELYKLDKNDLKFMADRYRCSNCKLLEKYLSKK